MIAKTTPYALSFIVLCAIACGSKDKSPGTKGTDSGGTTNTAGNSASMSGNGGTSTSGSAGTTSGGSTSGGTTGGDDDVSNGGAGKVSALPTAPGEPCNSVKSALPDKPCMVNVTAQVSGNAANITFDPIDDAVDYRVYELPNDKDITVSGDALNVKNAVYRCAGSRMATPTTMDGATRLPGGAIRTLVDGVDVNGYTRKLAEATLGYVSAVPGDGLVPVYALGDSDKDADDSCYFMRWKESRVKQYVTADSDRQALLAKASRDDGIVFYVPADGADGTQPVYTATDSNSNRYYYVDGPEASVRTGGTTAFSVFTAAADGLVPLMRVFYANDCGHSHDELVDGMARFDRARQQGETAPMNSLHWSGLTGDTTLVVEALADGCPNLPGLLAPFSDPSYTDEYGNVRPPWISFEDATALSPDGELYVNGQFDPSNNPRPIARSFVKVKPADPPDYDWFEGFDDASSIGTPMDEQCGTANGNCLSEWRTSTAFGDVQFSSAEETRHVYASELGELWVMYNDVASDTPGKFRLTAGQMATMADDGYLYVTMEVNAFTTARRYPQIIISDQPAPVQWNMPNGKTLIVQSFGDWPYVYEAEVCDHRPWDVNNQCPHIDLYHYFNGTSTDQVQSLAPNAEVGEETGVDSMTHFEVWVSSKRAYLSLNGNPYGCIDLPSGAPGAGPVTVSFGDTLYHSGVDALNYWDYMKTNFQRDTRRHFDNLGFKNGVSAPDWDESRLPCQNLFQE